MSEYRTFLIDYEFEGSLWGIQIQAKSMDEAKRRLYAIQCNARYTGELMSTYPAELGWFVKASVWLRNMFRA